MSIKIEEPVNHKTGGFVGIDFGTTNSLVGTFQSNKVHIFSHSSDVEDVMMPSAVEYQDGCYVIGKKARDSTGGVFSVKRLLGKNLESFSALYPLLRVSSKSNICLKIGNESVNVIEIASKIFYQLKLTAEKNSEFKVKNAVVTVPAHFDESARNAIKNAATLAGFDKIRLLSEPTAAALFYGIDEKKDSGRYAVYDLGGGTFDVSILDFYKGIFKVVTTNGDDLLGGDDFDKLIFDYICKKYHVLNSSDIDHIVLLSICKLLKEDLWKKDKAVATAEISGRQYDFCLDLQEFNTLISAKINKTIEILLLAIKNAKNTPKEIDGLLLVGGSTRIRLIKDKLKKIFEPEKILDNLNPDTIVAKGAVLYSSFLNGNNPQRMLLLDVLPLSLGIETFGGASDIIIEKDSHIPASHSQIFTNFADYQTAFSINVVQGEREFAKDNRSLAEFKLKNIPVLPAGKARIEVKFSVDESGILSVVAKELTQGIEQVIEVNPSYGLTKAKVEEMLEESFQNLRSDSDAKMLLDAMNYAVKILNIINNAVKSNKDILYGDEGEVIEKKIISLNAVLACKNCDKINSAVEDLEHSAKDFLQRRLGFLLSKMYLKI